MLKTFDRTPTTGGASTIHSKQVKAGGKEEELLRAWTQALGGLDRLRRIENVYIRGSIETGGMKGTFEEWRIAKGQHKQNIELGEAYRQLSVFNGKQGWILDQNGHVQELTGTDLENEITSAYLGSLSYLIPGRMPGRVEYRGEDETGRQDVFKILPQGGRPVTFYVDKATHLPAKMERTEGERIRTTHFSDWRDDGGIKIPYQLRQTVDDPNYDLVLTIQEVRLNVPLSAAELAKPQDNPRDFRFASGRAALGIPFELGGSNHVFLQAEVNGSGPFWFILDTGAATSIIDARLAKGLGLEIQGKVEGRTSGDASFDIGFVKHVSFSLSGLELTDQTIGTAHLEPSSPLLGRAIHGLLGYDFVSRFVVEIDYAAKKINLYDARTYQYRGNGEALPITIDGNLPYLRAGITLSGRDALEGKFLVDTGTSYFLELNKPFIERNKVLEAFQRTIRLSSATSPDESQLRIGRAKKLHMGRLVIASPVLRLSQSTSGVQASPDQDGIIGGDLLRRFKVIIDYSRHQLILEPNANLTEPVDYDMTGADIVTEGPAFQTFRVRIVIADSPAAEAGLREGDIITAINGRAATEFTLDQINKLLKQAGAEYTLVVMRAGISVQVKLKPRRLI